MNADGFFEWLGSTLGSVIRTIVDALRAVFGGLGGAIRDFSDGMARAIGMAPSTFNFAVLLIGLLLLYAAIRAFMSRSVIGGLIWLVLAVLVLGSLIG
ncbi:hypothetical protein FXN63_04565 [Pigmentiphaga aceris]|uniref:Uncharacterized protein n=1 Tax=Pigmentiphaga aceris TaxID=1940612 RepID=A0A5C0ASF4_9BURK|nr:hypothetical protein [Pigmentiphaga aceris]QEI05189.1 hypothetical protein FXN63_04565 [Pigmentiphaga aceris]